MAKLLNATLTPVGSGSPETFPLETLLFEGKTDQVNKIIRLREKSYQMNSLEWDVVDAPPPPPPPEE